MPGVLLPFLWLLNGLLFLFWLLVENTPVLLLLTGLIWLTATDTPAQRGWTGAAGALILLGAVLAPAPTSLLAAAMAGVGIAAVRLERFNASEIRWTVTRGLAIYGLMGLAYAAYRHLLIPFMAADPSLAQGQNYLGILTTIGLYVIPVGFLVLIVQRIWAHPPLGSSTDEMLYLYRARGKK